MDEISIKALKESIRKNPVYMVVVGKSMFPLLLPGRRVKVERANYIKLGDVIVYHRDSQLFIHRVIWKRNKTIITKGDFNLKIDPPVRKQNIIGKVKDNPYRIVGLSIGLILLGLGYVLRGAKRFPLLFS